MTPVSKKVHKPATFENYDISDLNSEDSTDEEDKPRKRIPIWAEGKTVSLYKSFSDHRMSKISSGRLQVVNDTCITS
jgi:hypothetical protein